MHFPPPIQATEMNALEMMSKVTNEQMFFSVSNASQHSSPALQSSALPLFPTSDVHALALETIENSVTGIVVIIVKFEKCLESMYDIQY